jgi:hypothetical protein
VEHFIYGLFNNAANNSVMFSYLFSKLDRPRGKNSFSSHFLARCHREMVISEGRTK